jgi:hypothetical protein
MDGPYGDYILYIKVATDLILATLMISFVCCNRKLKQVVDFLNSRHLNSIEDLAEGEGVNTEEDCVDYIDTEEPEQDEAEEQGESTDESESMDSSESSGEELPVRRNKLD